MTFAQPILLLALIVVPPALALAFLGLRRGQATVATVSRGQAASPGYAALALFTLAAVAGIVAAARPQWGERETTIPRTGAEVVFVLDVSRSMAVKDVQPDRIESAKAALTATLRRLGGDRVGLVIFAGDARLRFPLTTDFAAATQLIQSIETGPQLVRGGSSASSGLDIALGAFDTASDAGRLIVLITDGDDLGTDPAEAAARVRASGAELIVAGAGTPSGGGVPVFDSRTKSVIDKPDAAGNPIVSKLNEPFLRALAVASGGRYIGSDLRTLPGAIEGRLATLKQARFEKESTRIPVERSALFVAGALGFVVLGSIVERLPRRARRRRALGAIAAAALSLGACATQAYEANERAIDAFKAGDYRAAADIFLEAQAERPSDSRVTLNLSAALHADGRYDDAALAARRVLASASAKERNRAFASIGHHRFALEDLQGALDAFRQALIEDPGDDSSRHDYEVVLRLLRPPPDPSAQPSPTPTPPADAGSGTQTPGGAIPSPGNGAGSATPGAGQGSATPGDGAGGTPAPGATPAGGVPGAGPGGPGSQGSGQGQGSAGPASPEDAERQLGRLDAEIASLVRDAGDEPTTAQAIRILDLLAERAKIAAARDAFAGGGDPRDY